MREWARANRSFLARVITYLCSQGIDQFLDLGSGVPTVGNVHEVVHRYNPEAKVAYVDLEPVAVAYARRLLDGEPNVSITQADIRKPEEVLAAPGVAAILDLDRPIAVLAMAVLHALPEDVPARMLAGYRQASAPGSYLGLSHGVATTMTDEQVKEFTDAYKDTPTPAVLRPLDQVQSLLDGYEIIEPGLVLLDKWRPEHPVSDERALENNCVGAVGRLAQ